MAANITSGNQQSYDPGDGIRIFQGLDPDVVMIQEFNYQSNTDPQLRSMIDTAFGTSFVYFREGGSEQIPNGVISRWPFVSTGEIIDPNVSNRDIAWARIDIPGNRDLWAFSCHFLTSSAGDRNAQATLVRNFIQSTVPATDYVTVGGDFNTDGRSESCISTLGAVMVTSSPYPAGQDGDGDTNAGRNKPYDWVLADSGTAGNSLDALEVPAVFGSFTYTNGLVFDTRDFTQAQLNGSFSPALTGDSGATNMQHMGVVRDFLVPTDGATSTPSPTPSASPTASSTPTASPTGGGSPSPSATPSPTPGGATGEIFINEIHYDDSTRDSNEGVEVAGPGGASLAGWKLVPYNGSGGAMYSETALSGTIPTQSGCMGAVWFDIAGLQNGAPDAVALVNSSNQVIQFLSYEGVVTATDGPANGMQSVDIGVEESNAGGSGTSLSLQGNGNEYSDFTWAANVTSTHNAANTGQTFNGCAGTPTPTASASPSPSPSPTASPSPSPSLSPSPSPTASATPSPSPTGTASPSPTPTSTTSPSPSPTNTASPTASPTSTASPTASPTPTVSPTPSGSILDVILGRSPFTSGVDANTDGLADAADTVE